MKVLQINTKYRGGGAERVAHQLHQKLPEYGVSSVFLTGRNQQKEPGIYTVYESLARRGYNYLNRKLHNNAIEHDPYAVKRIMACIRKEDPNIVHFHNTHGHYMGVRDIEEIAAVKPIVWTLHDMWPITGHCCNSYDCNRWLDTQCDHCDKLEMYSQLHRDDSHRLLMLKKKSFTGKGIHFVTPSKWLEELVRMSYMSGEDVRTIHNGINIEQFRPHEKGAVRDKLALPQNKRIILFLGTPLDNELKGITYLIQALESLPDKEQYHLLMIGNCSELNMLKEMYSHTDFGYVRDTEHLNEVYSAADVFVFPSMADNYPCTILEAMASGTPCIAFGTGGIVEQIDSGTGWLVDRGDWHGLQNQIQNAFEDVDTLADKAKACRENAIRKFSEEVMIQRYIELYHQII